jgi:LacI family transcriptional regulator
VDSHIARQVLPQPVDGNMASANFGAICAHAEAAAAAEGYQLFVCNSSRDPARERRYIESLLERQVDGLVLFTADDRVNNLDLLGAGGPPVVLVESELPSETAARVTSDGEAAAAEATRYLIELGHRRIAFLAWGQAVMVGRGRLAGYQRALAEAGLPGDVALVRHCGVDPAAAEPETTFALRTRPGPTALIISAADLVPGALHAVRTSGMQVPRELSVLAFDNREATQFFSPPVTVMARNVPDLGTQAIRLLLEQLEHSPCAKQVATVPFSLVVRDSTGEGQ